MRKPNSLYVIRVLEKCLRQRKRYRKGSLSGTRKAINIHLRIAGL